nr:hypothetical protein [Tanacetum cinerariifolium]
MAQVHILQSQKKELKQTKAKAEVASMKAKPTYLDINQLTELLVTDTLNRFATMMKNALGATSINVLSAGKATASLDEGEKNTKDAKTNLQKQLIDLLGIEGASQDALKDQGYFGNGCSRHITGNISYLADFKEHDEGMLPLGKELKVVRLLAKAQSELSGIVPISTVRQSSSRAAAPVSVDMPINTVASKPLVNVANPRQNALQKSHSLSRRPFYQQTALKT